MDYIQQGAICVIDESATISLKNVVSRLQSKYDDHPILSAEIAAVEALVRESADERSLLALLLVRESERVSSPLHPYLLTFLSHAHENIPSAWDPDSAEGAARRAGLQGLGPHGRKLVAAADELRKHVTACYASLVPRALDTLPYLLGVEGDDDLVDAGAVYSVQRFAEAWLAIRSRAFENDRGFGTLLPVADLMNHPPEGEESNVEIAFSAEHGGFVLAAKRDIGKGEQMTTTYGDSLTAERALLIYGFPRAVWERLPLSEEFE